MNLPVEQRRRAQVIEHPVLMSFNHEFGTGSDLSRYETIPSSKRVSSPEITYLNQLQMDSFIPSHIALLLKNNLNDTSFISNTTRSALYVLKQNNKIGEDCFKFLHAKLDVQDFLSVYKYLYVVMLYTKIAEVHNAQTIDSAFHFESPTCYSNKLIKTPAHIFVQEERNLQQQQRKQFMKSWLTQLSSSSNCPREAQQQIFTLINTVDNTDPKQFRSQFLFLLEKLEATPELEKICWKELHSNLAPFQEREFFEQTYLRLKTESYYKYCLSRVTNLAQSLDLTVSHELAALSEKCKRAYNGCIYLFADSKNMPACSPIRFAALTGKMRTQWQSINNAISRAQQQYSHVFCACQAQSLPSQNQLATWPFNPPSLISLNPAQPITSEQILQQARISSIEFQENQKKTIAVIGCKWGGGHMEIARGISTNLSSLGYHPVTVDLPEVLMSEDPIRNFFLTRWLGKDWSKGNLYVGLIKEKAYAIINMMRAASFYFFPGTVSESKVKLITEELLKINPNAVIIDYAGDNEHVIRACEILGIPCLHVGADINNVVETRDKPPTYAHFKMALPFNVPEVVSSVENTITPDQRIFTGPPVKHEFTVPRSLEDIHRLKDEWSIDRNKKVVVVCNGLAGGFSALPELLANQYANTKVEDIPIHLVVLCGRDNIQFKQHLEQNIQLKTNLPMTIQLHSSKMGELMAMASYGGVLIGKAGTTTIFEAIMRGNRLLIDNVSPSFFSQGFKHFVITCIDRMARLLGFQGEILWEKDNTDFTKKHALADSFDNNRDFLAKLEKILNNDNRPVKLNIELINVEKELPKHLKAMINKAEADPATRSSREVHRNL